MLMSELSSVGSGGMFCGRLLVFMVICSLWFLVMSVFVGNIFIGIMMVWFGMSVCMEFGVNGCYGWIIKLFIVWEWLVFIV